jgi:diacylglycerol kinase (ATP)
LGSPFGKAAVIVGRSYEASTRGSENQAEALLAGSGIDYEILQAEKSRQTTQLARAALDEGLGFLVVFGNDREVNQIVNGIMDERGPVNPDVVVGVVPTPPGSDFLRTFGLSAPPADAVRRLHGEAFFAVDAVRVNWTASEELPPGVPPTGSEQSPPSSYFVNMAQVGLGAEVVRRAGRLPKRMGRVANLLSFWASLGSYKPTSGKVTMGRRTYRGEVTNIIVGNGQFYRDGIRMAVKAHPSDGKLDVLIHKGSKRSYVETITKSFRGEHLPSPLIKEYLAPRVDIDTSEPLPVEADSVFLGYTPANFEIVRNAYRLKI